MITAKERHDLLLAERSRDADQIYNAIAIVQHNNPSATLLDCEMCFRDAAAQTYLVMGLDSALHIVLGMQAWRAKLVEIGEDARITNYARLAQQRGETQ